MTALNIAVLSGSPLHGLMIDQQTRSFIAMKQALTPPLGVFGTEADFIYHEIRSPALVKRIELAVRLALPFLRRKADAPIRPATHQRMSGMAAPEPAWA